MLNRIAPFALLMTVVLTATSAPADTLLRYKYQKGDQFDLSINQVVESKGKLGEQAIETNMTMDLSGTMQVTEVKGDLFTTVMTIKRVQIAMTLPFIGDVKYDSAAEGKPTGVAAAFAGSVGKLVDAQFTQTMTSRGEVKSIELSDDAKEALQSGGPNQQISEDGLKQMFSSGSYGLPENPVSVGESWTSQTKAPLPQGEGEMLIKAKMTYAGPEKGLEKIDIQLDATIPEIKTDDQKAAVTIQDSTGKGAIFFDAQKGYNPLTNLTQTMKMTVNAQGQTINQDVKTTVTTRLTPVDN